LKADVVIAGAGYVGLATAVAIRSAAPDLDVIVADPAPPGAFERDTRASAVAAAAVRMLNQLGVWEEILREAQPITEMIVTDSRTSDPVRPVFLTFGGGAEEGEPFAHMVPNVELNRALRKKAKVIGVQVLDGIGVSGFEVKSGSVGIELSNSQSVRASLLIAADGVKSKLREAAGIKTVHVDYGQSGIVCTVAHERPHEGRAEEHFLPAGPFAILPLKGNRSSLVWTESTKDAEELIGSDDLIFEAELERRFGLKLGDLHVEGGRRAFPLGLTLAREFVKPRFALAGDAAHGIHPIAGQGLNLGFKDAAALAETIVESARLGLDIGSLGVLQRYEQWRRFDTVQMGVTTDVLNRLFSNDLAPIRAIRDIGLGIVDRMPRLKDFFIGQAAGLRSGQPKLLLGEAI
jgi:2-octaprenyl-6-methoxyphenol hydroxylase